jgi:molybdopterin converting factor small subunit
MRVQIRLFGNLQRYTLGEKGVFEMEFKPGATLGLIIEALEIPADAEHVTLVNGRPVAGGTELVDGDLVMLFPPLEGG